MAISTVGFSTQLYGFIGAATVITDIVDTRYTYGRLVQLDTFPALTFKIIGINKVEVLSGVSVYYKVHVQFDCFDMSGTNSGTANRCENLFDAVHTNFDRFTDSGGAIEFHHTKFLNRTEMVEDFDTGVNQISTDFEFTIKQ